MGKVVGCIDGSVYSPSVADHAAWAAGRMGACVSLLHVVNGDGAGEDDEARRWVDVEAASARVEAMGVRDAAPALREGDLVEALIEEHAAADLIVIGKRGEAADFETLRLGSNLERILRAARKPVLVASRAFRPIRRYLLAFDGGASAQKAVEDVAGSALFRGMPGGVVMAGPDTKENAAALEDAAERLSRNGGQVEIRFAPGPAPTAIPEALLRDGADLLIMGAYGHSRLRAMMIGSTTSSTIRASLAPIMVYR
jgi:nucleotide-binding universal stress UspA family protein